MLINVLLAIPLFTQHKVGTRLKMKKHIFMDYLASEVLFITNVFVHSYPVVETTIGFL